ncbi:MAG: bis(5'-nucleosyl)-tetraphosphatase (symmetrical) YqeK [Ruminococcus sp.]
MNMDYYRNLVKNRMGEKRFVHSVYVSKTAFELAKLYGADAEKAKLAGILHDCCKEIPKEEMLQIIIDGGIILDDIEQSSDKLWHSIAGACYVRDVLKIDDIDIFNSIKYHTTGRADMSILEKIIFTADFISEERTYNGVEIMREKALKDIDDAMLYGLQFTISDLSKRKLVIHSNAINCYNDIVINLEKKGLL